jgi:hypothetical protein
MAILDYFSRKPATPQAPRSEDLIQNISEAISLKNIELPMPKEQRGFDWVLFGPNNQFPMDILEYRNSSAIHDSIIEGKTSLIAGNGFLFEETRELSDRFLVDNWRLIPFWRKLDKIFWMVARDQETFGYSCFEVIYSMDRTRIVDINWIDASRIASGKKDEFDQVNEYYYSENWSNTRQYPPRKIDKYDPNGEAVRQLMFIKYDDNNMDYYAVPNYYSALRWIKADALMAEYNLAAINNGFSPSIIFKFFKKPSPEERRMNSEAIKAQHGGAKNAGKAIIFYADGKELAPEVQTLDATNIDARLLQVSEQITQQIITAHRCHPQLLGIQTPGKLGYSTELLQSWEIFNNMVIRPERKLILDAFKEVLIYNGVARVSIEEMTPIKIVEEEQIPQVSLQINKNNDK